MSTVREYERFHGLVLVRVVRDASPSIRIGSFKSEDKSAYVLDNRLGLYIKYSSKRLSPWQFSFHKPHLEVIESLNKALGQVCVSLVCGNDGVTVLTYLEMQAVLDKQGGEGGWVSVRRKRSGMYDVHGSDGKLKFKIAQSDCPNKILKCLVKCQQ